MDTFASIQDKIISREDLPARIQSLRNLGKSIVFTNGCFDIIHLGHVQYLSETADLADVLIIGLNSDDSMKKLKGPDRPVLDQYSRAITLASLSFVDQVVLFEEETPIGIIEMIIPDILVKGGDYKPDDIVGYDIVTRSGGRVLTLPLVEGYSTSLIIERIKGSR